MGWHSVIFSVSASHRDRNFGPESCIFRFQIQKYKSQILVKETKFRTVQAEWLTLTQLRRSIPQPQAIATQRRTRDAMTGPGARTVGQLGCG